MNIPLRSPDQPGDTPTGRAKRDIKEGEELWVWILPNGAIFCEAFEFFSPEDQRIVDAVYRAPRN